nr:11099_t:CDS:2 [Entrophospora candida]
MPFYIALTDAFLSFIHTINLSYTAANKTTWTQSSCAVIGGLVIILFAINALLVGIIAISTWLRVCKNIEIDNGIYDYKLWAVTITLSLIIICSSANEFGPQKFWQAEHVFLYLMAVTDENDNNEKESTLSPLPTFNTNKRNKPDLLTLRYTNLSHITVDFSNTE